jgi:hypothetical protein
VYDTLLFLHVLSAFMLGATVVIATAQVMRAPATAQSTTVSNALWNVGGLGTLIFGVWLALYFDGYELWDGWIIAALILWAAATELGRRAAVATVESAARWHWLRTAAFVLLLADMVWKPGA